MRSLYFWASAQVSEYDLEPVEAGSNPAGMLVRPDKLIVNLSVGSVLDTGWLGCGHARPVHFINDEVGSALLWCR